MKEFIYIIILSFLFNSCQKEKAESPAPFLIGEWEYFQTRSPQTYYSASIDSDSEWYNSIKIDDKENVLVYDKDGLVERGKIKNLELYSEKHFASSNTDLYSYKVRIERTSLFKPKYIVEGIHWISYWPNSIYVPGPELFIIRPDYRKDNELDGDIEMYYRRK